MNPSTEELQGILLRFIQAQRRTTRLEAKPEFQEDLKWIFGLVLRVRRSVEAYLRLARTGYAAEGEVLARVAIEHAVTAQWAFLVNGGLESLKYTAAKTDRDILHAFAEGTKDPDIVSKLEAANAALGKGTKIPSLSGQNGILRRLDESFLEMSYRVLSQRVHVTLKTMTDAFDVRADGGGLDFIEDIEGEFHHEALYCLASSTVLVSWVLARILGDQAELAAAEGIARKLGIRHRLDSKLEPALRRFGQE